VHAFVFFFRKSTKLSSGNAKSVACHFSKEYFFISFVSDKKTPLGVLYLICIKQTEMTLSEKVLQ